MGDAVKRIKQSNITIYYIYKTKAAVEQTHYLRAGGVSGGGGEKENVGPEGHEPQHEEQQPIEEEDAL